MLAKFQDTTCLVKAWSVCQMHEKAASRTRLQSACYVSKRRRGLRCFLGDATTTSPNRKHGCCPRFRVPKVPRILRLEEDRIKRKGKDPERSFQS